MSELPNIRVASIQLAQQLVEREHWDWVISIGTEGQDHVRPRRGRYVQLDFSDHDEWQVGRMRIEGVGKARVQLPTPERVAPALVVAHELEGKVLIHCHGGWCRSPAIALAIIAARLGRGRELEAAQLLEKIHPPSHPNSLVVKICDDLLHREGALYRALGLVYPKCLPDSKS